MPLLVLAAGCRCPGKAPPAAAGAGNVLCAVDVVLFVDNTFKVVG